MNLYPYSIDNRRKQNQRQKC